MNERVAERKSLQNERAKSEIAVFSWHIFIPNFLEVVGINIFGLAYLSNWA